MLAMSGLAGETFDLLALFDAFEREAAPFGFRDLILARKYAALLPPDRAGSRSRGRCTGCRVSGDAAALSLDVEATGIIARWPGWNGEVDGQGTLGLADDGDTADEIFEAAEEAEALGRGTRRRRSTTAACRSILPTQSPPSIAATALPRWAAPRTRRTTMPVRSSAIRAWSRLGSTSPV